MRKLGKMKFDALGAADFMNPLGHRPVFGTAHRCLVPALRRLSMSYERRERIMCLVLRP
jgi:hypothetical protein